MIQVQIQKKFNIKTYTKIWKYLEALPRVDDKKFKGKYRKYSGYIEGFDGYLSLRFTKIKVS